MLNGIIINAEDILKQKAQIKAEEILNAEDNILVEDGQALEKLNELALKSRILEVKVRDLFKGENISLTTPEDINKIFVRISKIYKKNPRFDFTSNSIEGIKLLQETPNSYKFYNRKLEVIFYVNPIQIEIIEKSRGVNMNIGELLEKATRDIGKLQKKVITNKKGKQQTVYVRAEAKSEEKGERPGITKTKAFGKNYGQVISFKYKTPGDKKAYKRYGIFLGQDENGNRHFIELSADKGTGKIGQMFNKLKKLPKVMKFQKTLKDLQKKYSGKKMKKKELYQQIYQDFKEAHGGKYTYRTFKAKKMRKSLACEIFENTVFISNEILAKASKKYAFADANFYYYLQPGGWYKKIPKKARVKEEKGKEEEQAKKKEEMKQSMKELHKHFTNLIRANKRGDAEGKKKAAQKINEIAKKHGISKDDMKTRFQIFQKQYQQGFPKETMSREEKWTRKKVKAQEEKKAQKKEAMGEIHQIFKNFSKLIRANMRGDEKSKMAIAKEINSLAKKNGISQEMVVKKFKEFQAEYNKKFKEGKKKFKARVKRLAEKKGISPEELIQKVKAHVEKKKQQEKIVEKPKDRPKIFNKINYKRFLKKSKTSKHRKAFEYIDEQNIHDKQLIMGILTEMEHTNDPSMAEKIAKDHLRELSDYYTRLRKMEKQGEEDKKKAKKSMLKSVNEYFGKARKTKLGN